MAWTSPKTWKPEMVIASELNANIKDNFNYLSTHSHDGTEGNGATSLLIPTLTTSNLPFVDQETAPTLAGGMQRNALVLEFYDGTNVIGLTGDSTGASIRTLGLGAIQAAAGNHTH